MNLSWIAGHSKVSLHYSSESITLSDTCKPPLSLAEFCHLVIPPCRLNPLLFNGHLQTVWTIFKNPDIPIYYRRKIFQAEDPAYEGSFAVDFVVDRFEGTDPSLPPRTLFFEADKPDGPDPSSDTRPMLVALHGLSGGSHELYLRHVLAPLVGKDGGWEACVVNSRGCALSKITSSVLFNARATWDVRQVVKWLHRRYPNRPLFGVGFSLGANILVNVRGARCSSDELKPRECS